MRVKLINYEDLSDSRELLNAREPNFIAIFIYFLLLLMISMTLWLWFGQIDIVVKATGIVRTITNVSVIRNINEGTVIHLNYHEGQKVQKGDILYAISNPFHKIENENYLIQKNRTLARIEMFTKMEDSVLNRKNLFQPNRTPLENEFYNRYEFFQNRYEQLKSKCEEALSDLSTGKNLYEADIISKNELEQLERDYKYAELEYDKYFNETMFNIKNELKTKKDQLLQIKDKLNELAERLRRSRVQAPISGVIQVIEDFNNGDFMPAGIEVLKIIPEKKTTNLKMELTVANKDIGLIKTGQQVKYRFLALPFKEYGVLTGKVTVVAGDISGGENSAVSYQVEGTVEKLILYDKNGVPAEIKVGMLCDARIVVKRKKLLYIVLEKLDFR